MPGLVTQVGFIRLGPFLVRNSGEPELRGIHAFALSTIKTWITGTRRDKAALHAGRGGPVMTMEEMAASADPALTNR